MSVQKYNCFFTFYKIDLRSSAINFQHPIRSKTKTNGRSFARIFLRLTSSFYWFTALCFVIGYRVKTALLKNSLWLLAHKRGKTSDKNPKCHLIPSLIFTRLCVTKSLLIVTSNLPFEDFVAGERNDQN